MIVTLTPDQQAWLEQQVKQGALPSIEVGVQQAVADLMAISESDLAWARPLVDAARADVASGNIKSGDDVIARLRSRVAK